ncbi:MAG TPA: methyl-accepting chemotaxis protein [Phycisphaerales bacterium]|nr:methyl-accepting chemotaxis protein [Phycisphaerales bacterium]
MLRRRLMIRIGALVLVYITGAVVAIILLQGVLDDLGRVGAESEASAGAIDAFEQAVVEMGEAFEEGERSGAQTASRVRASGLDAREALALVVRRSPADQVGSECLGRIRSMLDRILAGEGRGGGEPGGIRASETVPDLIDGILDEVAHLRQINRGVSSEQQVAISRRLRNLIVALTVAALIALNVTILLFLRLGWMIVRPVEALVAHSRELARERYGHRVEIGADDEFGELADSYNRLAEQLSLNEQRKTETLKQLGVSLNHELNNVISTIEYQLDSLDRHTRGDEALKAKLEQIHGNLRRISETVSALKDVRRVVVTEYTAGTEMLDLPRCVEPDDPADGGPVR